MPPLPKRKISKGRRDRRRSHDAINKPTLVECPQCHSKHLAHRVCPECGVYRGRTVLPVVEEK
ncbi:MAG: 50S ribosomal protein L32 [Caldilineales bacterium]